MRTMKLMKAEGTSVSVQGDDMSVRERFMYVNGLRRNGEDENGLVLKSSCRCSKEPHAAAQPAPKRYQVAAILPPLGILGIHE